MCVCMCVSVCVYVSIFLSSYSGVGNNSVRTKNHSTMNI